MKNIKEMSKEVLELLKDRINVNEYVYLSDELQRDKDVILEVVKQDGYMLQYVPVKQRDKEVVLEAVKQCGEALDRAGRELQGDKEVVLEAVKQSGWELQYASKELK